VASAISGGSQDAASRVQQGNTGSNSSKQAATPQLNGVQKKTAKNDSTQQSATQTAPTSSATDPKQTNNASGTTNTAAFDISLNTATVSVSQSSPDTAVMVTTADNSNAQWTISPEDTNAGLTARVDQPKSNTGNTAVHFRTDNAAPGVYQFTVTAKDAGRSVSSTKTITVTVTQ